MADAPTAFDNIIERGKTELTQNITRLAALWLDGKGFKPVETEVYVCSGWIADVAAVCTPTQTEMINLKLIRRPPRFRYGDRNSSLHQQRYEAWRNEFNTIPRLLTALIEVKTSRADFRKDMKWGIVHRPTNLCYLAAPDGLVRDNEWPEGWGRLIFNRAGTTLLRQSPGIITPISDNCQLRTVLSVAVRRDHATRYAHLRQLSQRVRIEDGERKSIDRIRTAISFVLHVAEGMPIDEAKACAGLRTNLPPFILERLAKLPKAA